MGNFELPESEILTSHGLNLHAVFDIQALPLNVKQQLDAGNDNLSNFRQIILLGHGGRDFWDALKKSNTNSNNPVDDYTCTLVNDWLYSFSQAISYKIIFPGPCDINLQGLGQLAGWHHPSPLMLGINNEWGTWYAYRALVLTDSEFFSHHKIEPGFSPCDNCNSKPCITSCHGKAVSEKVFLLEKCVGYRKQENSPCRFTCQSRMSCPVATEHRYSEEQINYHYKHSLQTISGALKGQETQ